MIDIHTHIGRCGTKRTDNLDPADLVRKMDANGIDKSVVLPLHDSPSGWYLNSTTEDVLIGCQRFPERLIPFAQVDPRFGENSPETNFSPLLAEYKERGCLGVGEITANLYFDDPMVINLMRHCGKAGLPALFHAAHRIGNTYGLVDDLGLRRLEKLLQACPETIFIAHGPAWWSEISPDVTDATRGGYPKEPIIAPGRVSELLETYSNLYGDLSAGSGYNAIARTPDFGYKFLERFQDQLLFGTDILRYDIVNKPEILTHLAQALEEGKISKEAYIKIGHNNAAKLLGFHPLPPVRRG